MEIIAHTVGTLFSLLCILLLLIFNSAKNNLYFPSCCFPQLKTYTSQQNTAKFSTNKAYLKPEMARTSVTLIKQPGPQY